MEKNKQFEDWFNKNPDYWNYSRTQKDLFEWFENHPFSMQWGVYLEFFDSVGIRIEHWLEYLETSEWIFKIELDSDSEFMISGNKPSRQEAQTEAIKNAFEILKNR